MTGKSFRFERLPRVMERFELGRDSVYRQVKLGRMPAPVKVGERASAWISTELDAVAAAIAAGEPEAEIKALVTRLHAARGPAAAAAKREAFGIASAS